jgi:hypothetical protein
MLTRHIKEEGVLASNISAQPGYDWRKLVELCVKKGKEKRYAVALLP